MPNELRQQYDALVNDARLAGLGKPELLPGHFKTRWSVNLADWNFSGDTPGEAMMHCNYWLSGYSACLVKQEEEQQATIDRENTKFEDLCNEVLGTGGMGGPHDHMVMVNAMLELRNELKKESEAAGGHHQTL
jgi:hypothetical protein